MTNLDRKDLKIQALLEKVSSLTTQYENQIADLRVELTIAQQQLDASVEAVEESAPQTVPGEVVKD